jgi:hypothetical protein
VMATLLAAMASGRAVLAQQNGNEEGQIIQIGPDQNGDEDGRTPRRQSRSTRPAPRLTQPGFPDPRPPLPSYWIGLVGGPVSPELRHHVDLPEDIGLMVMDVVPDSPADEAGLAKFDIMVRANDVDLKVMADLVDLVLSEGEQQGQIAVEVLRGGQQETMWITPIERPADALSRLPAPIRPPLPGLGQLFQHFGRQPAGALEGPPLGPGVVVDGQQTSMAQLPNGVSVKVEKRTDEPTKITVERDGEKWEIEGDDTEALDQLPEDVRPYVEQMLHPGGRISINGLNLGQLQEQFQQHLPQLEAQFEEWAPAMGEAGMSLLERIQQMEEELRELHRQVQEEGEEEIEVDVEPPPLPETDVELELDTDAEN